MSSAPRPHISANPARVPPPVAWAPSAELLELTEMLTRANLVSVGHRTSGLRHLQALTASAAASPIEQLRTCGTIKTLPFLRISKRLRVDRLHTEFVAAGRAFNRELLAAKIAAGDRLEQIAKDTTMPHEVQRLAAAVSVRASTNMKVEWAELTDREIPEHLLPPPLDEIPGGSTPAPVADALSRAANSPERAHARAVLAAIMPEVPVDELYASLGEEKVAELVAGMEAGLSVEMGDGPTDIIFKAAMQMGQSSNQLTEALPSRGGGMHGGHGGHGEFGEFGGHGGKRGNGFKERKRVSR